MDRDRKLGPFWDFFAKSTVTHGSLCQLEAGRAHIPTLTQQRVGSQTFRLTDAAGRHLQEGTVAEVCRVGDSPRLAFVAPGGAISVQEIRGAPGVGFRGCGGEGGSCMWG